MSVRHCAWCRAWMPLAEDVAGTRPEGPICSWCAHVRPEVHALAVRGGVTWEEWQAFRGNSYEFETLYPKLTDDALVKVGRHLVDNCRFDTSRPWRSYNEAVMGFLAPWLLERFERLLESASAAATPPQEDRPKRTGPVPREGFDLRIGPSEDCLTCKHDGRQRCALHCDVVDCPKCLGRGKVVESALVDEPHGKPKDGHDDAVDAIDHYRKGLYRVLRGERDPRGIAASYLGEDLPPPPKDGDVRNFDPDRCYGWDSDYLGLPYLGNGKDHPTFRLLWHCSYHDAPIDGVCLYEGKRCWFRSVDEPTFERWDGSEWREGRGRRYVVFGMTPEDLAAEEESHARFREHVGTHTDYVDGERKRGELRPSEEHRKFYDWQQENPLRKVSLHAPLAWFGLPGPQPGER